MSGDEPVQCIGCGATTEVVFTRLPATESESAAWICHYCKARAMLAALLGDLQ